MYRYEFNSNNIQQMKNILKGYSWISFDIFDTLIKRKVKYPSDVFSYIEKKYGFLFFKKRRLLAEKLAYKFYGYPDINQIYHFFLGFSRKRYIDIEIQTEKELSYPNPEILELYKFCISENKNIIITSDMYIPKKVMIDYLKIFGYKDYKKIYISSDIKKSKAKGNIYDYILDDLSIKKEDIIHIGDNFVNDIINAKMDTIFVKKCGDDNEK